MVKFSDALERQQQELREMYMDPAEKLKLQKQRKEEKAKLADEENARLAALPPEGMTSEEFSGTKALFDVFDDSAGEGRIPRTRMGSILVKMGMEPTEKEIEESQKAFDQNNDGYLDFKEFAKMAQHVRRASVSRNTINVHSMDEQQLQEMRQEFYKYDVDGNGTIDHEELALMLKALNIDHGEQELEPILAEYDRDGDGVLSFGEFASLVSRLRALTSGDEKEAQRLQTQWLKRCSQNLQQRKRARQAAIAAAKNAFKNGKTTDEAVKLASAAAAATQAALKDIQKASECAREKMGEWLKKELFLHVEKGNADAVVACLQKGARSNWTNPDEQEEDMSALMTACKLNKAAVVGVLVSWEETDVNESSTLSKSTPLHMAARSKDCKCLKLLLAQAVDVHATSGPNSTPVLYIAAQFGNKEGVQALIQAGASIDTADSAGVTPLMAAVIKKQFSCAEYIARSCGADMNVADKQGNTAVDHMEKNMALYSKSEAMWQELDDCRHILRSQGGRMRKELQTEDPLEDSLSRLAETGAQNRGAMQTESMSAPVLPTIPPARRPSQHDAVKFQVLQIRTGRRRSSVDDLTK